MLPFYTIPLTPRNTVWSDPYVPAVSERQRKFMAAELGRKTRGKKTKTGMTGKQLADFARKRKARPPQGSY